MKKRGLCFVLAATMTAALFTGCGTSGAGAETETAESSQASENESEQQDLAEDTQTAQETFTDEESVTVRVGAMSGPTAMGMVKLMDDSAEGQTQNTYQFAELSTEASAFVAPLASGELDIAAVPSNLAATIYNNTEGGVEVIATCNLGVLNVVERGESVSSLADLAGKTIYATGQGAVPEYTIRYLLDANGVDPDNDVTIQWCSDTTEALSYINADESAIAILPQPFVTAACAQVEDLRVAIDLNDEWAKLDNGCSIITGVVVVRTEFAEQYPEQVATFLEEYQASVSYTEEDVEGAAALIEQFGIVGKAAIAQKALPECHLTALTGSEMRTALEGFLQILYDQNPAAVGGSMPGDDFYFGI
jgi:NitT/TauT family transport system substrate-binding protein